MGDVLGIGISHYPPLSGRDEDMANILRGRLDDPGVPESERDPANWPAAMQAEWGDDRGVAGAARHRADMLRGLRRARAAIDEFDPDFVIVWGDDQYENFKESIVPAFCMMAYDDMDIQPWAHASESAMFSGEEDEWGGGRPNVWGERRDFTLRVRGNRDAAKHIASKLIERDFDLAYAYEPLNHPGLPHAFLNTILYLDYDRTGWRYPVLPFQINCYGRRVISYRGFISRLGDERPLDPPSPSPRRVFAMGAEVARICRESPWRVALVASASWSHAFMVDSTYRMRPDIEADRRLYDSMVTGNWDVWKSMTLDQVEAAGDQELLNWFALAGAMDALGQPCSWSEFVETHVFNSSKVAAIFEPATVSA